MKPKELIDYATSSTKSLGWHLDEIVAALEGHDEIVQNSLADWAESVGALHAFLAESGEDLAALIESSRAIHMPAAWHAMWKSGGEGRQIQSMISGLLIDGLLYGSSVEGEEDIALLEKALGLLVEEGLVDPNDPVSRKEVSWWDEGDNPARRWDWHPNWTPAGEELSDRWYGVSKGDTTVVWDL